VNRLNADRNSPIQLNPHLSDMGDKSTLIVIHKVEQFPILHLMRYKFWRFERLMNNGGEARRLIDLPKLAVEFGTISGFGST
jgi:hypothetical protein